nr:MAG TPA: hypothetical protein [Caudoviricetes sp.]
MLYIAGQVPAFFVAKNTDNAGMISAPVYGLFSLFSP